MNCGCRGQLDQLCDALLSYIETSACSFNSESLAQMSSLLSALMSHPRHSVSARAVSFWAATFAQASALEYPRPLR